LAELKHAGSTGDPPVKREPPFSAKITVAGFTDQQ
jgi:hypothetical protein